MQARSELQLRLGLLDVVATELFALLQLCPALTIITPVAAAAAAAATPTTTAANAATTRFFVVAHGPADDPL